MLPHPEYHKEKSSIKENQIIAKHSAHVEFVTWESYAALVQFCWSWGGKKEKYYVIWNYLTSLAVLMKNVIESKMKFNQMTLCLSMNSTGINFGSETSNWTSNFMVTISTAKGELWSLRKHM